MLLVGIVLALILLLVLGTFAYAFATLPDPSRLDLAAGDIKIVDRHGALIEQRNAQGVRVIPVELKDISINLRNATIAVEDKHFYQHHGVDWGRVIKAGVIDVITRRPQQGASTITEQLAKIAILQSPKKSILRKLREANHATGIEAAAETYFGKHAKDLTIGEAALLAGLPNGPTYFDPALHKDRALARQAIVLDAMVNSGMITSAQAEQATNEPLKLVFKENRSSQAPHFVDYVFEQMESTYGPSAVNKGGFSVKTTLDLNLQKAAEQAVAVGQQRRWAPTTATSSRWTPRRARSWRWSAQPITSTKRSTASSMS